MANGKWRSTLGTTQQVNSGTTLGEFRPGRRIKRQPTLRCATCGVTILATDVQAHARANGHPTNPVIEYRRIATQTGNAYLVVQTGVAYNSPRTIRRVFRTGRLRQVA